MISATAVGYVVLQNWASLLWNGAALFFKPLTLSNTLKALAFAGEILKASTFISDFLSTQWFKIRILIYSKQSSGVVPGAFSAVTSRFVDKYVYKIIKIVLMGQNGRNF